MTYEQLIIDPVNTLKQLYCFLLDVKSVDGTVVEVLIKNASSKGNDDPAKMAYKLKADTGKLCAKANLYTEEQLSFMSSELRDFMHFFGYASHPEIKS